MNPKVSIILVNYNGFNDTVECVESLLKLKYKQFDMIVVDNGSTISPTEGQMDFLKTNCVYIENRNNTGFSGGNNVGIQYAVDQGAEYVLLLNNDTVVEPDFLDILVCAALTREKVGIVGGKIKYYSEPDKIWYGGGGYNRENGYVWHERYNQTDTGNTGEVKEETFVTGCLMLIPVSVLDKVGLLDESFFLYAEDTEFCCRVLSKGYKIWFCEDAVIYHKVSASTGADSFASTYYSTRNILMVAKKYCKNIRLCYKKYGILWMKKIIKGQLKIAPVFKGWRDYKKGITGPLS